MSVKRVLMAESKGMIEEKETTVFTCLKCGYQWQPKHPGTVPGSCPKYGCRSPNWQKPKGYVKPYAWKDPVHKAWIGRKDRKFPLD